MPLPFLGAAMPPNGVPSGYIQHLSLLPLFMEVVEPVESTCFPCNTALAQDGVNGWESGKGSVLHVRFEVKSLSHIDLVGMVYRSFSEKTIVTKRKMLKPLKYYDNTILSLECTFTS